jgi:hypothetical protein
MPVVRCPRCACEVPPESLDPEHELVICRACLTTHNAADLRTDEAMPEVDLDDPPRGCAIRRRSGETRIVARPLILGFFGSAQVRLNGAGAEIHTRVGPLALIEPFDPARVHSVRHGEATDATPGEGRPCVVIDDGDARCVGVRLDALRRAWLRAALRRALLEGPAQS